MKEINNIWQFFENLNEYVYATDIETYEMVYMNRKTLEAYGLKSLDEIKGRKCYEILQKSSIPCGMCNNDKICEGFFEEWRHYNSVIDKYLILKDTLVEDPQEHRKYRLEIGIDISEERIQDKALQKYNSMEALLNEGLRIALMAATPDESIHAILEYLGKSLNGERTYIFEKNRRRIICRTFHRRSAQTGITDFRKKSISYFRIWKKSGKSILCNMRISRDRIFVPLQLYRYMMMVKLLLFMEWITHRPYLWNIHLICFRLRDTS